MPCNKVPDSFYAFPALPYQRAQLDFGFSSDFRISAIPEGYEGSALIQSVNQAKLKTYTFEVNLTS